MGENKNILPLEMEIESLRQKVKDSNNEIVEECERLRSEIQNLYFQIARTTRPGRYAEKRNRIKNRQKENQTVTPEVIPPDLDVSEYLKTQKEVAAGKEEQYRNDIYTPAPHSDGALVPLLSENTVSPGPVNVSINYKPALQTLRERDKTIEERFARVAKRMQERRRQWLESQEKKRPWWRR